MERKAKASARYYARIVRDNGFLKAKEDVCCNDTNNNDDDFKDQTAFSLHEDYLESIRPLILALPSD